MNLFNTLELDFSPTLKKILSIMKLTVVFLIVFSLNISATVYSQTTKLSLNVQNQSIKEVLYLIENQSDFRFIYESGKIDLDKKVSVQVREQAVEVVLKQLFNSEGINYEITENNLILINPSPEQLKVIGQNKSQVRKKVTGFVKDQNGEPIIGANVVEKGTTNGTITDVDGRFSLDIPFKGTLLVSYIGYTSRELMIENQTNIEVQLVEDTEALDEIVVIGYGTVKKKDLTGAITQIRAEEITQANSPNIGTALQGKIPVDIGGVWKPGNNPTIEIRGISSITGSNDPLWVVDGIPMQSSSVNLNPNDVQSIDVLKDASASAIYGARGSNGVIIVTTKRAEAGENSIKASYSGWVGFDKIAGKPNFMSADEFVDYKRRALANAGQDYSDEVIFDEVELNSWKNRMFTDWYDEVWGGTAFATNHNVTVSASSKKTATMLSLGYLDQSSLIDNAGYKRFNVNFNNTFKFSDRLKLTTALLGSYSKNEALPEYIYHVYQISPLAPVRDENGELKVYPTPNESLITNPLSEIQNNQNATDEYSVIGSAALDWNIWDGLSYKFSIGLDYSNTNNGTYNGSDTRDRSGGMHSAGYNSRTRLSSIIDNILSYNKEINGIHQIGAMAAFNVEQFRDESVYLKGTDMYYDGLYYNLEAASTILDKNTLLSEWGIMSFMGRFNYTLLDRYLLTLTYRYDGSSRLSDTNKWAGFPSMSVAWRISEESFLRNAREKFLDNLKLRFSWGNTGNTNVDPYETLGKLSKTYYSWDESAAIGTIPTGIPNPDLKWEKTEEWNVGLDFGLFNSRLNGTIDWYRRTTKDLILERKLPVTSGYSSIFQNIGSTRNQGVELTLNGDIIRNSEWRWNVGITFAKNNNEILDLYGDKKDDVGSNYFIGHSIRSYYLLDFIGVWQENEAEEAARYGAKPGYPKYRDIYNKEGEAAGINLNDDRYIISRDPKWIGSLNTSVSWKNFDFYMSLNTRQGVKAVSETHKQSNDDPVRYIGFSGNYWSPENKSNEHPAPAIKGTYTELGNSDYFVKDVSFVRISNLSLGYTLPKNFISKLKMGNAKVYININNPFVFTPFDGQDPQVGTNKKSYPAVTSYQLGVNLDF
ncbi:TonB-dependent receptor [Parabacteroides sp.]